MVVCNLRPHHPVSLKHHILKHPLILIFQHSSTVSNSKKLGTIHNLPRDGDEIISRWCGGGAVVEGRIYGNIFFKARKKIFLVKNYEWSFNIYKV